MTAFLGILTMLVRLASAVEMDDRIEEARAYLRSDASKLSTQEKSLRTQALEKCTQGSFDPAGLPERPSFFSASTGGANKAVALRRVLNWHQGETTWESNGGILNWMRDSVISDCRLFRAELIFLKELQKRDLETGTYNDAGVPIQKKAGFDVLELARSAVRAAYDGARDDTYLALKVLGVYGHDNLNNTLRVQLGSSTVLSRTRCEWAVLDAYAPGASSTLYRNGAIKGLEYSPEQVSEGERVASACSARCAKIPGGGAVPCLRLCNDSLLDYQADYYHVVAASYLNCYAEGESARGVGVLGVINPLGITLKEIANSAFDHGAYSYLARKYKKDRFREVYAGTSPESMPRWMRAAYAGVDRIPDASDAGANCTSLRIACTAEEIGAAQAILDRYRYEVLLRQKQHEMGQQFAQKQCGQGRAPLEHPLCSH